MGTRGGVNEPRLAAAWLILATKKHSGFGPEEEEQEEGGGLVDKQRREIQSSLLILECRREAAKQWTRGRGARAAAPGTDRRW